MPTTDQINGLRACSKARQVHSDAEKSLLAALTDLAAARQRLANAEARGDEIVASNERTNIARHESKQGSAKAALQQARDEIVSARAQALGPLEPSGDGFDLLSAKHPLLLLPVRLETRFAWTDGRVRTFAMAPPPTNPDFERVLLVRVYPDEIHQDSHEPELPPAETGWVAEFAKATHAARDIDHLRNAWSDLVGRVGSSRAGWLAALVAGGQEPGRRPGRFSRPSHARLLPDRWVAFAELDDGSQVVSRAPAAIREPLETGPSSPEQMDWMTDFDAALRAGMALMIDVPAAVTEVLRLVVVGARGTLDPSESKFELERLFDAHHFTRGLALLAPGTPTNSIPGERARYTSTPDFDDVFSIEHRRLLVGGVSSPLCKPHDFSNGTRLAESLGIDPATFAYVALADGTVHADGVAVRVILRAALERRLTHLLNGILDAPALQEALSFAVDWVNPLGPLSPFRVGAQPYGVLPVLLRGARPPATDTLAGDLLPILDRLRSTIWEPAAGKLDWVGKPKADPGPTLISILQQDAVARQILFRPLLGPQLANRLTAQLDALASADLETSRTATATLIDSLGAANSRAAPIVDALHLPFAPVMTAPLVQRGDVDPLSNQCARVYLELVASLPLNLLARNAYGGDHPRALLFAIARLAMLELADSAARELVGQVQPAPDQTLWDDEELPDWVANSGYDTPVNRLEARDPLANFGTIAERLSDASPYPEAAALRPLRDILCALKTRSPDHLEELLRAHFGILSHRLDAWYTGLATVQLSDLRANPQSETGVNVGAYGVVEHIAVAPRLQEKPGSTLFTSPVNGGFIHAPSANHAAAAAVLRSVHLGHAACGHGEAFSVDLSSERVRRGLELLEGIREGQPLGALIGYRIERALVAEGHPQFVPPWRSAAPIVAHRLTQGTEPAENVAASNVVDGLVLLELAGYDGTQHAAVETLWKNAKLPALPAEPAAQAALQRVLAQAEDMVDSVADLVLAESVFQAVQGNPLRAGAAVDSASGAPAPPTEPDIVRTPRTGVATTHRLLVMLGEPKESAIGGWASTPRARAEPRLEAWARMVLPDPAQIRVRAVFPDVKGNVAATLDITLATLHEKTEQPYLRLGALDVVALADPHDTPHRTALEVRLAALVEVGRPPGVSDRTLQLVFEREVAWKDDVFGLVEVLEVARSMRDVVGRSRGITPADLCRPSEGLQLAINEDELMGRAADAVTELNRVRDLIYSARKTGARQPWVLREALFAADGLGIAGASPSSWRDTDDKEDQARLVAQLLTQVSAVQDEIAARQKKLDLLPAGDSTGRLQLVFGESFVVLPLLKPTATAAAVFDHSPDGATSAAVRTWIARSARVRAGVRALDSVLGYADAVAEVREDASMQEFRVVQLGGTPAERWVGLKMTGGQTVPGGRISIVAVIARAQADLTLAGLLVDEWIEVVPSDAETTSVAFHYDGPSSTAPQTLLLGVPLTPLESWTAQSAYELVVEALALAKLRLVDPDALPEIGQLLPAFIAAENTAGDTIGLDVEILTSEGVP